MNKKRQEKLLELEKRMESNLAEVGACLLVIRDERLYKQDFSDFDSYCLSRWEWTGRHCRRLIDLAIVQKNLGPTGQRLSERQARALAGLPIDTQQEVWSRAADEGNTTSAALEELAAEFWGQSAPEEQLAAIQATEPVAPQAAPTRAQRLIATLRSLLPPEAHPHLDALDEIAAGAVVA